VSEVSDTRGAAAGGASASSDGITAREVADAKESFTDETAGLDPASDLAGSRDSFIGDTEDSVKPTAAVAGDGNSTTDGTKVEEFGPYVVYERLGQGGMATVHRAEKRGIGFRRPVALKRLFPHVAADPELVKLFVDEARLASHLHHGNIAQTYELGRVGDIYFIAMEYASGPTLGQIVRQCQLASIEIPLSITVNILIQVCDALDYAHNLCDESGRSLRIIHRDVSPANIIVSGTGIVKLIDFGIAKATTSSVKTQTGFIKGKFGYIAPEYITGRIDARVDLFALGVIAHEMLAGKRLFEGKDDFETMANIRDMVVQRPSRWNPRVPPDLDDIIMTALERDPGKRWQSAGAMQIALASAARELGVVVGSQQMVEWVEWAFNQAAADSGPVARPESHTDETNAMLRSPRGDRRPGSSLSIEVEVAAPDGLDVSTMPGSPRASSISMGRLDEDTDGDADSESDATVAIERVAPHDSFETLTPPAKTPKPMPGAAIPTPTVPTRALSDSRISQLTPTPRMSAEGSTPLPRITRPALPFGKAPRTPVPHSSPHSDPTRPVPRATITAEAAAPVPATAPRKSITVETAVPPPPAPPPPVPLATGSFQPVVVPSRDADLIVMPRSEPPKPVRKLKPRSQLKATHKTRPATRQQTDLVPALGSGPLPPPVAAPRRAESILPRAPVRRPSVAWVILAILALGAGAMAAAYYWPDL
jgi:serine/threonine protein kinase